MLCLFQPAFIRYCQFLTALCPSAGQYLAAIGSLHTLTETVNGLAALTMRLESTFHFYLFFRFMKCGRENGPGFKFHQQITTLAVCERTAKVREAGQKYEAGSTKFAVKARCLRTSLFIPPGQDALTELPAQRKELRGYQNL